MEKASINFNCTGHVFFKGNLDSTNVWIVFHGYGQTADSFLDEFPMEDNTLIIAPEGLSHFYNRKQDRVMSSWMTSRFRDESINNYLTFLNTLRLKFNLEQKEIRVLGFSQGAETASRWAYQSSLNIKELILWGGKMAPEINENETDTLIKTSHYIGRRDPLLKGYTPEVTCTYFEGGHEINKSLLQQYIFNAKI